eukprot:XP_024437864.1 uncharacterized protein LOC18103836 [Populus trichocarpa]
MTVAGWNRDLGSSCCKKSARSRNAADCALVLDAIRGKDPGDLSSRDVPLDDPFSVDIKRLTVGYTDVAEMEVVHVLVSKGVNVVPFKLNYTVDSVQGILNVTMDVEMLAHFDEWQRTRQDDLYEEAQDQWPTELLHARVIPAVDYVQVGPWHDKANGCRAVLPWAFGKFCNASEVVA